jgi:hypothetical protein
MYLIVFQAYHSYGIALFVLGFALIFVSLLSLQFLWIDTKPGSFWSYNIRSLVVLAAMVPVGSLLIGAEHNFENKGLQLYGVKDTEIISDTYKTHGKNGVRFYGVYQYVVNGKKYTHELRANNDIYEIGDTVQILYSSEHPDMDKILRFKKARR